MTQMQINERLNRLESKLDKLVEGNGQPGMIEKIVRLEENLEKLLEASRENTKNIGELTKCFGDHDHNQRKHSLKEMVLNKQTLAIIVLSFVALHSFLPENLTVWSLLSKLLGY